MPDRNGTLKISWRLGVLVAIIGTIIGGSFWAGRFTSQVEDMNLSLKNLQGYSRSMGIRVDRLREFQVADDIKDQAVERRLEKIEDVLVRIEDLLRGRYRAENGRFPR